MFVEVSKKILNANFRTGPLFTLTVLPLLQTQPAPGLFPHEPAVSHEAIAGIGAGYGQIRNEVV